jgi:hypothetical protein
MRDRGPVGGERGRKEGEERRGKGRGELTSGLDNRWQSLNRIPPRAREMEERWKRGRGKLLRGEGK